MYEGEFFEDAITGHGKFKYASGACYEGQWLNGQYSGKGKYSWADGRSYEVGWATGGGRKALVTAEQHTEYLARAGGLGRAGRERLAVATSNGKGLVYQSARDSVS